MRKLIAFDMDGTLLNTAKKISDGTAQAIQKASEAGKIVILATGRSRNELTEYESVLGPVRYGILESGGVLYDFKEEKILERSPLTGPEVEAILALSRQEDVMVQTMSGGRMLIQEEDLYRMDHYQLGYFFPLFSTAATRVEDIRAWLMEHRDEVEKINLYHTDTEARERTLLRAKDLMLEKVYSEVTSIEFSPKGVSKGDALLALCRILDIDPEQTIAVGDADNDLALLKTAGLAIAMGNANENVKRAADVIVADNDHDGCKEAIERFLL